MQQPECVKQMNTANEQRRWQTRPLWAAILIGGKSSRMGRPKHLLPHNDGNTWLERTVTLVSPHVAGIVLCGKGEVPDDLSHLSRLDDVAGIGGPMSGVMAALQWRPQAGWLILACDMPNISVEAIEWLLKQRQPAHWATVPRISSRPQGEPLFACYEPQMEQVLATLAAQRNFALTAISDHEKVVLKDVPVHLCRAWSNINTPVERDAAESWPPKNS